MPTSIALTRHFEAFVRTQVESGRFNNVSEVVRAGLRLLEDQQLGHFVRLQALKNAIAEGMADGADLPANEVLAELETKYGDAGARKPL